MSEEMKAIYSPETGRVGCVLIQAAFRCSRTVAQMFDTSDWDTAPQPTMVRMTATVDQWQCIADMTKEQRIKRWQQSSEPPK